MALNRNNRQKARSAFFGNNSGLETSKYSFYEAGLANGGTDNGEPGPRPNYGPTYYAAFVHDPEGNNIEAMLA